VVAIAEVRSGASLNTRYGQRAAKIVKGVLSIAICLSSSCIASFTQSTSGSNLLWAHQIIPELGETPHRGLDNNRAGVRFVNNDRLIVFAIQLDTGQLSSRESPETSSPFRLRIWVLNANSGSVVLTKDFGTRVRDSQVEVTSGGVLVKTGSILKQYSAEFEDAFDLTRPVGKGEWITANVSFSGKTIVTNRPNQVLKISRLDEFDPTNHKLTQSWQESPPLYHSYSISDEMMAAFDVSSRSIVATKLGTNIWKTIGPGFGLCPSMNAPTFYEEEWLVYGCDKLIAASTDGGVRATVFSPNRNSFIGNKVAAAGGRFVAVSLDTREVRKHLLSEATTRILKRQVAVFDLKLMKCILTVEINPLPQRDYDFALSSDGSTLTVLCDRTLSLYSVFPHDQ